MKPCLPIHFRSGILAFGAQGTYRWNFTELTMYNFACERQCERVHNLTFHPVTGGEGLASWLGKIKSLFFSCTLCFHSVICFKISTKTLYDKHINISYHCFCIFCHKFGQQVFCSVDHNGTCRLFNMSKFGLLPGWGVRVPKQIKTPLTLEYVPVPVAQDEVSSVSSKSVSGSASWHLCRSIPEDEVASSSWCLESEASGYIP